jgi:hypothetical protein
VNLTPDIAILPAAAPGPMRTSAKSGSERSREITVTVTNNTPGTADADVSPDARWLAPRAGHVEGQLRTAG